MGKGEAPLRKRGGRGGGGGVNSSDSDEGHAGMGERKMVFVSRVSRGEGGRLKISSSMETALVSFPRTSPFPQKKAVH